MLLVRGGGPPHKFPGFAEGHWTVQDAAATLIGTLAPPAAGDRVALELCAAPGGKTTHTASLLRGIGTLRIPNWCRCCRAVTVVFRWLTSVTSKRLGA